MSGPAKYAVGLDVGSAHTRCLVCALEDSRMRYLGHSDVPSVGLVERAASRIRWQPPRRFELR